MERYMVDGQPYDVAPNRLDEFLKKFPNASKTQSVEKTIDVAEVDAPVTSQTKSTASKSENTSSESQPKFSYDPDSFDDTYVEPETNTMYVKNDKLVSKESFETTPEDVQEVENKLDLSIDPYYKELKSVYDQTVLDYGSMSQAAADAQTAMLNYEEANMKSISDPGYNNELQYDATYNDVDAADKALDKLFNNYYKLYLDQGDDQGTAAEKANAHVLKRRELEGLDLKKKRQDKDIIDQGFENIQTVTEGDDLSTMSWDDDDAQSVELTDEIKKEIFKSQGLEGLDRAAQDNDFILSLNEKENIITQAKSNILEKKYTEYTDITNTLKSQESQLVKDFEAFDIQQKEVKRQLDLLGDVNESSSQEDIAAYNNLVNQSNQLTQTYDQLKVRENTLVTSYDDANNFIGKVFTEIGYNAANESFDSNFEVTDKIQEYKDRFIKKSLETDSWWKKKGYESWDAIATFANEGSQLMYKSSAGLGGFLGYQVTRLYRDDTEYFDSNEFLLEAFSKPGEVELFAESQIGADISNKLYNPENKSTFEQIVDPDAYNVNFRNSTKMIGKMLPFTLGIMYSGGGTSAIQGTTMYTKGANLLKNFAPIARNSKKIKDGIRMLDATYRMTITDNYTDAINQGLDEDDALIYANGMSMATGLSQMIMPDRNFFKTPAGQGILQTFTGNLKKAATIDARKKVLKTFVTNIAKELGEEELEMAMQDIVKLATLENFHSEFLDAEAQRNVIVGTLLLSGSLGTVGGAKNYKKTKQVVYDQYKDNAQDIIDNINIDLELAENHYRKVNSDNRYNQKSKEAAKDNFEQVFETKKHAEEIRNAIKSAPEAVTADQLDLLIEKQRLVNKKQNIDKSFHADIDNKIKGLDEAIQNTDVIRRREEILNKTISNVNKVSGNLIQSFENSEQLKNHLIENGISEEVADYNSRQEGFFDSSTGEMFINKAVALSGGNTNVAAHEFLHKLIAETVNNDPQVAMQVGQALGGFLVDLDAQQFNNSTFRNKLMLYQENPSQQAVEVLTLASDALASGDITVETTPMTKVKDFLRRIGQNIKGSEIKFNTSEDVFNFIRDYNASIKKGKLTRAQQQLLNNKKIEGALTQVENEIKTESTAGQQQSRSEASAAVQQIYSERGSEGIFDIIEAFKPITNRLARKYSEVPGYDEEMLMTEIELSQRGLYGLVNDYDPQSGVPLAAYINKFLPSRAIEAAKKILKENFEADITEARGVAAEETSEDLVQAPERRTKLIVLADRLNVSDQLEQVVANANIDENAIASFKKVPNAAVDIVGEMLGISPKKIKSKANLTAGEVRSAQQWFIKNAALVVQALPQGFDSMGKATGVPKTVLEALYNKRSARAKTKAGLHTQVKRTNILDSELLALVDIIDGTPTRNRNTSARVIALADLLGKVMTNQELRRQNPALARISDGMSPVMFAKSERQERKGVLKGWPEMASIYDYVSLDFSKDTDRNLMIKWIREEGSQSMTFAFWKSVLQGSGGKYTNVTIDGKKVRQYELLNGSTILETDPNFNDSRINHVPSSKKHVFANVPQMREAFKGVEFAEETDALKAMAKRKGYGNKSNDWAQKQFKDPKTIKFLNDSEVGFIETWLTIQESIKNLDNKKFWGSILESTSVSQGNFVRINSKYGFHNTLGLKNTEEHAAPATEFAQILWALSNDGVLTEGLLTQISENFVQGALPEIFDNILGPYKEKIPEEYHHDVLFGVIPFWVRYINPIINKQQYELNGEFYYGVNPNVITLPGSRTLAQAFGVGVNPALNMNQDVISMQQDLLFQVFTNEMTKAEAASKLDKFISKYPVKQKTEAEARYEKADLAYYSKSEKAKGMSTFDFDETLIIDGENFIVATKGDDVQRISSGNWPLQGPRFAADGYEFDFTDFVNVRGGVDGPLLQKMKNQIRKYGTQNVFVLTARPQESATAIHEWLKTKGVNIPFKNITGLGNSTGDAKAAWFLDKYAEGYNDMYFVDDALPNVEAVKHVFDQLDIKGKSVQARINYSKSLSAEFNSMLERSKGVGAEKTFSRVEARKRGKNKGGFTLFVPPSAEDFTGLLRYFVGKGEQGNADIKFFEDALVKPFAKADREMSMLKQNIRDEYRALTKKFPAVKKKLGKLTDVKGFTFDAAIRTYLYDKAGYEIPGLANNSKQRLINLVKNDPDLRGFADGVGAVSRQQAGYLEPEQGWDVGSIAMDLQEVTNRVSRKQFLQEWVENKDIIFSEENMNKIEAVYGSGFRSSLEDIMYRMESGRNRPKGRTAFENKWNNWINSSVGAIMFFNARSAVLQTLSTVNFINFEDNNIFAASRAFANQKQYWSDFSFLFNSDFLKNRRAGLQTNVNEAELASAVAGAKNKAMAALRYLLKIGFTPTQVADSFAIASGGATYYRNRVKRYLKEGMDQASAESRAMLDFREIAEETQQSARPDRISQQQASNLGRVILAFANTPLQYNRLIKKAAGDLVNRRGDWRSNVSRILYYGAAQNFIFAALQNALFAMVFDDDEDKEEIKNQRIANSMLDSLLRGSGIYGAALATVKNTILEYAEQDEKGFRADYGQVIVEALQVSPPIGSKARKLYSAMMSRKFNKDIMKRMSMLDYNNPAWTAIGNVVEATTNLPMSRAIRKMDNLREAMNQDNTNLQRLFLALGWSSWDLNVGEKVVRNEGKSNEYTVFLDERRQAVEDVKTEIKDEKKQETVRKKEEKKKQKELEEQKAVEDNLEKQKKEGEEATCAAMTSSGSRCKRKPVKDGFCTVHEKTEERSDGKEVQCSQVKSNGKRCKMKTKNKSGLCYYHD